MAVVIKLRREHINAMLAHALEAWPIECCGLLAAREGCVEGVYRAKNVEASPYRFKIDPLETGRIERAIDETGAVMSGTYHSHTGSPAVASPTDIRMMTGAGFTPPFVHFVIGVKDWRQPEVRVFHIEDGASVEHEYEIIEA